MAESSLHHLYKVDFVESCASKYWKDEASQALPGTPKHMNIQRLERAEDWEYLCEGGANMIFKYTGSEPTLVHYISVSNALNFQRGWVARIRKVDRKSQSDCVFDQRFRRNLNLITKYYAFLIDNYIGPSYFDPMVQFL